MSVNGSNVQEGIHHDTASDSDVLILINSSWPVKMTRTAEQCITSHTLPQLTSEVMRSLQRTEGCNCSHITAANNFTQLFCSKFFIDHEWYVQAVYILLFSLVIVLAVCGNLTVIWVVLRHKRMRSVTNYFLLNLAVGDFLIATFNLGSTWSFNLYYVWVLGYHYCAFNNFMGVVPTCASVFTMVAMSYDRYVAIVHPLTRRMSQGKTVGCIVIIWLMAFTCGMPALLFSHIPVFYWYDEEEESLYVTPLCRPDNFPDDRWLGKDRWHAVYNNFLVIIQYLMPLVLLSVTYARVACALWNSEIIGDTRHQESIRSKRKVVKMLAAVVSCFMICWLPYHLYFSLLIHIMGSGLDERAQQHIYLNIYWLAMSSTIVNPFLYCWLNERSYSAVNFTTAHFRASGKLSKKEKKMKNRKEERAGNKKGIKSDNRSSQSGRTSEEHSTELSISRPSRSIFEDESTVF